MTDLDRISIDRLLPASLGGPDWDDVLARSRAHEKRRRLITLAVAVLAAVVATASSFAVRAIVFDGGGVTALPPLGTKPSTPATGRIVLDFRVPEAQVWV
ncbi:MAG TPA: hypothetical protein VFO56_08735, partial [Gaiellaceae bacterium]|nr:hypothetical protein [Gaiellaceae bacterium]